MKKLRVVQIGLGHDHSLVTFGSLLSLSEYYEVLGFILPPEEEGIFPDRIRWLKEKGATFYDLSDLETLAPDAVVVEAEDEYLTKYAQYAIDRGYPVHMDKPGAPDLPAFEKMIASVKEKDVPFQIGYMYRYNPMLIDTENKIKRGVYGDIYSIEAQMSCIHPVEKRRWLKKYPGGMMFFLGCHLVDIIYRILGEPIEVIPLNQSVNEAENTGDDFGFAVLRYKNGSSFIKTTAVEEGGFTRRQVVFCGTDGTAQILPTEEYVPGSTQMVARRRSVFHADTEKDWWNTVGTTESCEPFDRYNDMMIDFAKIASREKKNEYTLDYELALFKLLLRCCGKIPSAKS